MKKIVMLTILLFSLFIGRTSASNNLKVYLFDELKDMDNPVVVNGNTLVPLRVLFESLGASVTWDDQTKTVAAKKGNTNLFIPIGDKNVIKNGSTITLEEPAAIINGKTYVPLRFVAESFNQDVRWDSDNNAIHIGKEMTAKDISKLASPAVVFITKYDSNNAPFATGSGFIIDSSGIIVTNYHVIDMGSAATVKLIDGTVLKVSKVMSYDVVKDIAILKIEPNKALPIVNIGNSDKVENGEKVFAIGSPKGYENTISEGIVSNKNQFFLNQNQIQITAQIAHGSSGGALFNTKGEVIGITDGGREDVPADINFAIPINIISSFRYTDKNLSLQQVYNNEHVITFPGGFYIGGKKNNQPDGFGIMSWDNRDKYEGYFANGARNGKGKYTWAVGAVYEGDWENGIKQGTGKKSYPDGTVYEGLYRGDIENGKGKMTFSNGDTLYCDFLNGLANGYGKYYYANGTSASGIWINGKFENKLN